MPLKGIFMQLSRSWLNPIRKRLLACKIQRTDCVRLNVGAGGTRYSGWISIEKEILDITKPDDFSYFFAQKKISKILAEHVVEHIYEEEFSNFLCFVKEYLEPMASIRIAVPDAYHPSIYVHELTKPGGLEPGADDHKVFYSIDLLREVALKANYIIHPVEFFDEEGLFHSNIKDWNNGYISRSSLEYKGRFTSSAVEYNKMYESIPTHLREQFVDKEITYTSLIVDFVNA